MKKELDVEKITRLYLEEKKTTKEISEIIGNCSLSTINRTLKRNGVKLRGKGNIVGKEYNFISPFKQEINDIEGLKELFFKNLPVNTIAKELKVSPKAVKRKIDELGLIRTKSMMSRDFYNGENDAIIVEMYNKGKSTTEIAKFLNFTHRTIIKHLEHCGIKRRALFESHYAKNKKTFPNEIDNYEVLYDLYVARHMSKREISEMFNVSPNVVDRLLKKYAIKKRTSSEAKIGIFVGEKHPNWKGGRSGLYARLREYFRMYQVKLVIERDGKKCQICGSTHKLQVHHIRHFKDIFEEILLEHKDLDIKKNEEQLYQIIIKDQRMNDLGNLITYCKECHLFKVHGYKKYKENG